MMRSRFLGVRAACGAALLCASVVASSPAGADPRPQAPLHETLTGPAKAAYESATILVNNGDYAGALAKYEQAYAVSKDPRLLFNMAVCARSLRAYARMRGLLLRYRKEAAGTLTDEDRAEVEGALTAVRGLVASVKLTVNEDGAVVSVDGENAGTTPLDGDLVLDLGKHVMSVKKPGFEPDTRTIEISGGDRETAMSVALVAAKTGGALVVAADDDALVTIDDDVARRGRFDGEVTAGTHRVRVTEPGKISYDARVEIRTGETRTLVIALENEHGAQGGPVWPWIVAGAAVVAGATVGGYFLFQSHTPGPAPPSGQLGSVQFASWRL
ncbi:MAG TPA: PEGA domain-containing protein [Polyangiaceae bacterium]|jgi:hypothetical protein|nr:PEGA domain-containing protein [Polyangiaceae bacterium]